MDRNNNGTSAILPYDVDALLVEPVTEQSLVMSLLRVIPTARESVRLPRITKKLTARFIGELEDYPTDNLALTQQIIRPRKVGMTVPASRELVDDSDPSATELIGTGLINAIATAIDDYTFGTQVSSEEEFAGLASTEYTFTTLGDATKTAWNLDNFIDAQTAVVGATGKNLNAYVANTKDVGALNKIKESTTSARNILQPSPDLPGVTVVGGVPILGTDSVPEGTIWGFSPESAVIVLRDDSELEIDRSVGFKRDEVWFKGSMRLALGVIDTAGIVKLQRKV